MKIIMMREAVTATMITMTMKNHTAGDVDEVPPIMCRCSYCSCSRKMQRFAAQQNRHKESQWDPKQIKVTEIQKTTVACRATAGALNKSNYLRYRVPSLMQFVQALSA